MNLNNLIIFGGNIFLALLSIISYKILEKSATDSNPRKFVNKMMLGVVVKLFSCIIAAAFLIWFNRSNLVVSNIYILMFLYIIYTSIETRFIMKYSKSMNV